MKTTIVGPNYTGGWSVQPGTYGGYKLGFTEPTLKAALERLKRDDEACVDIQLKCVVSTLLKELT